MRRLALLLGVLGATLGCFASYVVLRDALEVRARHKAFERLATSDVVRQERKILQAWKPVEGVEVQGPDGKHTSFQMAQLRKRQFLISRKKELACWGLQDRGKNTSRKLIRRRMTPSRQSPTLRSPQ